MNEEKLIEEITYFMGINKISKINFAKLLKISVNTLNKILKGEHVKITTQIYVREKFKKIKEERDK